MTIPLTGQISFATINVELGRAANAPISLNETAVRQLAGIPSGPISFNDLRGKSALSVTASNVTGDNAGFAASGFVESSSGPSASVIGGVGPFTYNWTRISGSTAFGVSDATALNPTWFGSDVPNGANVATWRLTVTDTANGNTASIDITVTLTWTNLG